MRKYPILLLALVLLLGVSAVFAARAMDAPKDQVAFTERVIYGDPAAADGLTVALHEQYRNYLHWASTLSFTESSYTAHTDYTFEHDRYWNNDSGVVRSLNIWDGITASYDFDQDNALAAAVNALEDKVQPGTTASAPSRSSSSTRWLFASGIYFTRISPTTPTRGLRSVSSMGKVSNASTIPRQTSL